MIILGSGSRGWTDRPTILRTLHAWYEQDAELVVGDCPDGADPMMREIWARYTGRQPSVFEAHWTTLKKAAGHHRNGQMVDRVLAASTRGEDHVCLFFVALGADRQGSPGTMDCLAQAQTAGLRTVALRWPSPS